MLFSNDDVTACGKQLILQVGSYSLMASSPYGSNNDILLCDSMHWLDSWFDCWVSWCDLTTLPFPLPSWMITSILKVCMKNPWDYHQKPTKLWLRTGSPQSFDPPLHDTNIICKYWNRHSLRSTFVRPPISFPSAWSSLNAWGCRFAEGDSRVLQQMLTRDLVKAHSKFPVAWPFVLKRLTLGGGGLYVMIF